MRFRSVLRAVVVMVMSVLGGAFVPVWAQAGDADLDALERRLKKLENSEPSKPAQPAVKPKPKPAAEPPLVPQVPRSTLVINADADCDLRIDGAGQGRIGADQPRAMEVPVGELLVQCDSVEIEGLRVTETRRVQAGDKAVVLLRLASEVSARRKPVASQPMPTLDEGRTYLGTLELLRKV